MLLENLYTIRLLETAPDRSAIRAVIMLNGAHPVFEGHFPGNPILPGVCTVQIIEEMMEASFGKPLLMTGAESIKYLGFINPEVMTELEFRIQLKDSADRCMIACAATVSAKGITVCSLKGSFSSFVPCPFYPP